MTTINCPGFKTAGIASGIKKNGKKDLGLIFSKATATVVGVFTQNLVKAAPVVLCKARTPSEKGHAILVNSGNANCCTGEQGRLDAEGMARLAADALDVSAESVFVASTGEIGEPLPMKYIEAGFPELVASLQEDDFTDIAEAIMTTDTVPKYTTVSDQVQGQTYTISGIVKGAGMIRPDMATMLCFVCTDVAMPSRMLQDALVMATDLSFNRITIDGDTSTNDTVLVMANGTSGVTIETDEQKTAFQKRLNEVLIRLARKIVKDGEGASKLVEIKVNRAMTDHDALQICDTVSHSNLVKTALFGEDANWGRIIAAVGRAGVPVEPGKIDIFFDAIQMVQQGTGCGKAAEADATRVLQQPEFSIVIDLNMGSGSAAMLTCDFSIDYVKINADYRT